MEDLEASYNGILLLSLSRSLIPEVNFEVY